MNWESIYNENSKEIDNLSSGKHVLVINDTTEFNFTRHKNYLDLEDNELGPLCNNNDIGFFLHPGLVIDLANGVPLGFSYLKIWNRRFDKQDKYERNYPKLPIEEKESYRWIECGIESKSRLKSAEKITIIADRESDIYEEFAILPDDKTELIIRSRCDRVLKGSDKLYKRINSIQVSSSYQFKVSKTKNRKARDTEIEIKYTTVEIKKPENLSKNKSIPSYIELTVIEAKEKSEKVPKGEKPIHWIILTTYKINSAEEALKVVCLYAIRWQIELLYGTMKSKGLKMESSELEKGKALKSICVLVLFAALKINQLRQLRNDTTGIKAEVTFTNKQITLLKILNKNYEGQTAKQHNPYQEETIAWAAWIIARLGGWKGYDSESPPGNKTFKWGLDRFYAIFEGYILKI